MKRPSCRGCKLTPRGNKPPRSIATGADRQSGIALVMVLWLVVLITVIGSSHARNMRLETTLAFNHVGVAKARALAEGGINRAIMELFVSNADSRWRVDGTVYPLQFDNGSVNIAIRDASGLLDLNKAAASQLETLLDAAGAEEGTRQKLVDAVLDWRDKDQLRRLHGAEDSDYRHAGLGWESRDGLFASIDELRYVLGMTHELFERLAPYLTVHSGRSDVNLEYAPAWLYSALTSSERESTQYLTLMDTQPAGPFHISAWATSNSGSRASLEAVITIARTGKQPFTIVSWQEPARSRNAPAEQQEPDAPQ